MKRLLGQLDALLRARTTDAPTDGEPFAGPPKRLLLAMALALGGVYGAFMGWYAVRVAGFEGLAQLASTTVKLPLLFLLTLAVTFPSLYVFNTLLGSRLTFPATLRLALGWITVMLAVAASLGPILGFFTISADSYIFIVILNVILLGLSGVVGCGALLQRLRSPAAQWIPRDSATKAPPTIVYQPADVGRQTLFVWIVVFGVVGLQMAWVMRPFIGAPGEEFAILRPTGSHIFAALLRLARVAAGAP